MPEFLTIAGVLTAGGAFELEPGFQVELEAGAPEVADSGAPGAPRMAVEFVATSGQVIADFPLAVEPMCLAHVGEQAWMVSGLVPWQAGSAVVRFHREGRTLVSREVADGPPKPILTWSPGELVDGLETITWSTTRSSPACPTHLVTYSWDGGQWLPLSLPLGDDVLTVDFNELPGGEECRIRILSTDGVRTGSVESAPFHVPVKGVTPVILAPQSESTFAPRAAVTLVGQLYDWEARAFRPDDDLEWTSTRDGPLGGGGLVETRLTPGEHLLTLSARGVDSADRALVIVEGDGRPAREA